MKKLIISILIVSGLCLAQNLENPVVQTIGVGTRAMALGQNYVALSNDVSGLFYNPAGLAFAPVREFQFSLGGQGVQEFSDFSNPVTGKNSTDEGLNQRINFGNIGGLWALPTSHGGMSIGLQFSRPYIFDDVENIQGSINDTTRNQNFKSTGQFNLFTLGAGIQVAPGLGVGASLSLLTGRGVMNSRLTQTRDMVGEKTIVLDDAKLSSFYYGYDVRIGCTYQFSRVVTIGFRLTAPQTIKFNRTTRYNDGLTLDLKETGTLTSSVVGDLGLAINAGPILICTDGWFRSPHPDASDETEESVWKLGAGIGFELPITRQFLIRAGYNYNEFDRNPLVMNLDDPGQPQPSGSILSTLQPQTFCTGISLLSSNQVALEISYSLRLNNISMVTPSLVTIDQTRFSHRILGSIIVRY